MENKKLGVLLVIISLIVGGIFIYYAGTLSEQSKELGCFNNAECASLEQGLSVSHIAIGIFSFILALGIYLLLFNKTDEKIMSRLENEKKESIENEKFNFALKFLDPYEKKVILIIREQEGITQSTLRLKADMSKAKLSYVLSDMEKKGLIKRIQKGKTLAIYLKI